MFRRRRFLIITRTFLSATRDEGLVVVIRLFLPRRETSTEMLLDGQDLLHISF